MKEGNVFVSIFFSMFEREYRVRGTRTENVNAEQGVKGGPLGELVARCFASFLSATPKGERGHYFYLHISI